MTERFDLSPKQARKLVLVCQGVYSESRFGTGASAVLKAIEQLSYIQIDTISVVERAHHHTLWNRVKNYRPQYLDMLQRQGKIFEYWSHAAAYLPMRDYRFSLPRKQAIASGERHWFDKNPKLCREILKRIEQEGPLQARDFQHTRKGNAGWWDWKPAKQQLEQLFMEGELMIALREGFKKVYDLTERVLPTNIDSRMPSNTEFHQHLIQRYLTANGIGTASEIGYLRKGIKAALQTRCQQMVEKGELVMLTVNGQDYFALPNFAQQLQQRISRQRVKILSPFDNLVIQRQRLRDLFNFDYQIECYVPQKKRKFGYFSLPLLWGDQFAGRMDAKIERNSKVFSIKHLHIETSPIEGFLLALKPELQAYVAFNGGRSLNIEKVSSAHPYRLNKVRKLLSE